MSEDLYVTYTVSIEDIIKWNQYHHANSPTVKRAFINVWVVALAIFAIYALLYALKGGPKNLIIGIVWVVAYVAYTKFAIKRSVVKNARKLYKEGKNKGVLCRHTIRIVDDGIIESTDVGESKTNWAGIERVVAHDGYTFIYIGALNAHVIPGHKIESGDYQAFVNRLNQEMQNRTNSPSAT